MKQLVKSILPGGILSIVDQGIGSLSNLLTLVVVARVLTPANVGAYAIIFASIMVLVGVQNAFITGPLRIFYIKSNCAEIENYLRNQFRLQIYSAVALAVLLFALSYYFSRVGIRTAVAASIAMVFMQTHEFVRVAYLSKLDFKSLLYVDCLSHLVRLIALFLLLFMESLTLTHTFYVIGLGGALATGYFVHHQGILRASHSLLETLWENWKYGKWLFAETVAFSASTHFYIYVIALVLTAEMVAGFNVVQSLLNVSTILITGGGGYLVTVSRRKLIHEGYDSWKKILIIAGIIIILSTLVIVVVFSTNGEWLLATLYGDFYKDFYRLIPILGGAYCLLALNTVLSVAFRTAELPHIGFIARLVSAVFTVVFAVSLLESWGLNGAAVGLLVTQACWLAVYLFSIYKGSLGQERVTNAVNLNSSYASPNT